MQIALGISPTIPSGLSAFSPASISGLQLWLDASDSSTLFQNSNGTTAATADGDPVGYWGDKSGNGKHATQNDGANKPALNSSTYTQNSKNGIVGDGVSDRLVTSSSVSAAQPFTYFIVHRMLTTSALQRTIGGGNDRGNFDVFNSEYVLFSGSVLTLGPATLSTVLIAAKFNNTNSIVRINGTQYGPGTAGSDDPTTLAVFGNANNFGNQVFYEILVFNSISDANRNLIESYLNAKWSIY